MKYKNYYHTDFNDLCHNELLNFISLHIKHCSNIILSNASSGNLIATAIYHKFPWLQNCFANYETPYCEIHFF